MTRLQKKAHQQSLMIVERADKTKCRTKDDKSEQRVHDINEPHETSLLFIVNPTFHCSISLGRGQRRTQGCRISCGVIVEGRVGSSKVMIW